MRPNGGKLKSAARGSRRTSKLWRRKGREKAPPKPLNPQARNSMDTPKDPLPLPPVPCSALDEQRNALAEARLRIIARYEHVETWLRQSATEQTLANWAGMVEGLRQARQIIGAMWDELPVPTPQAVIDHEAHMRRVIEEQNKQLSH